MNKQIFYCPQCEKFDKDFEYKRNEPYFINIRDGFGHPIYHIKCECGNYLAGFMRWSQEEVNNDRYLYDYIKEIIKGYNLNGRYLQKEKQEEWYNYIKKEIEIKNKGVR